MSVRVRFAPSPTGYLHIGGARTCLYNYLFAKSLGGKCLLRVEDTDLERSTRESEISQIEDMKWLGLEFDEGPHVGGDYGPYRQSERLSLYKEKAELLISKGKAFYCFCTEERLEKMKEELQAQGKDPHYDGLCLKLTNSEVKAKLEQGTEAVVRFRSPAKDYSFTDHVRGEVTFPHGMIGDFVLLRSNGMPTYNYCCVVDDWQMKISHVIRAEEHLNNTLRQLMLYEAFGVKPPEYAHVSLLVGKDRQKLSKRHGATSVKQYREEFYLPEAINNYLCLLGWSHPEEKDVFSTEEAASKFDLGRFSKSPALYDIEKLNWMNGQYLKKMTVDQLLPMLECFFDGNKEFSSKERHWKELFTQTYQEKVQLVTEFKQHLEDLLNLHPVLNDQAKEVMGWETTPQVKAYLKQALSELPAGQEYVDPTMVNNWMEGLKKAGVKGKNLFMGMRVVLTGLDHGADLKNVVALTPVSLLKARLQ